MGDNDEGIFYFKRIKHKWVMVWDSMLNEDPRYGIEYGDKLYRGLHRKDLPKQLTEIKGI